LRQGNSRLEAIASPTPVIVGSDRRRPWKIWPDRSRLANSHETGPCLVLHARELRAATDADLTSRIATRDAGFQQPVLLPR
jgi:hypothetical protein